MGQNDVEQPYKLTIVIPVYNVSKYIERCLKSILPQMNGSIELVIVDDETPDNSIELAKDFLSNNCHYRVISQKNRGLGGARNTGLREARGEYVWFVDSDDEIEAGAIDTIINIDNQNDVIVFDHSRVVASNVIPKNKYSTSIDMVPGTVLCSSVFQNQVWCCVYRRNYLLDNAIFFRERFLHEDGEFNMRAITLSKRASYLPISIYKYHDDNSSSIMHNIKLKNQQHLLCYLDTRDTMISFFELNEQQKSVVNRYVRGAMALFFYNACFLESQDMKAYRNILRDNRKRILESYAGFTFMEKLPIIIEAYFPWKYIYRIIFRNHA